MSLEFGFRIFLRFIYSYDAKTKVTDMKGSQQKTEFDGFDWH